MNFKFQLRDFLISNSKKIVSIKIVLGCFPILFGLSKPFYFKHQDQTVSNILKHNLPGTCLPQIEVSWPTFEQILSYYVQFDLAPSSISNMMNSSIKRVDFYSDSALMQTLPNWYTKQKQLYIGIFNNSELNTIKSTNQIGNNWYTIFSKANKQYVYSNTTKYKKNWNLCLNSISSNSKEFNTSIINNGFTTGNQNFKSDYFSNLDELPLKLNCNYSTRDVFSDKNILKNILLKNIVKAKQNNKIVESKKITKFSTSFSIFSSKKFIELYKNKKNTSNIIKQKIIFQFKKPYCSNCLQSNRFTVFPDKTKKSFISLKKIQNFIPQIQIHATENKLVELRKNCSEKENFLENTLKKDFYDTNFLPFSNFNSFNFSPETNIVEEKNIVEEENIVEEKNIVEEETVEITIESLLESLLCENWSSYLAEISELLKCIEETAPFHENSVILPRAMSGYVLPDTSYKDNVASLTQFLYRKNSKLFHTIFSQSFHHIWNPVFRINFSKKFSYSFNFFHTKLTRLQLRLFPQSLYVHYCVPGNETKQVYQGVSIAQNTITNELNLSNFNQVKNWIKQFLNADTILTDRRETFFGKNVYAEKKNLQKMVFPSGENNFSSIETKLYEFSFLKDPLIKNGRKITLFEVPLKYRKLSALFKKKMRQPKINKPRDLKYKETLKPYSTISADKYPYVIYLEKYEWNKFFKRFCKRKTKFVPIPITHVRIPKQKPIVWPLNQLHSPNLNTLIFDNFKNKKKVFITNKSKLVTVSKMYHYFPYSQTLVKEILPKNYFFGKLYKKNYSIYKNKEASIARKSKFTRIFQKPVEPISIDSWLIFCQFSIGFFLLQILQNIIEKYGNELTDIVVNLVENKNPNQNQSAAVLEDSFNTSIDIKPSNSEKSFRLIKNIKKNFRDIAGIDSILPELSEIVWFLRNSGRSFTLGNNIPRRILLTGPPGTGKTLLVQAISGEAEVPVLIESGSSLNQLGAAQSGLDKLKDIFAKAREIAPCIIFIDEIDTFGEARDQMVESQFTENEILDCLYSNEKNALKNTFKLENFDFRPRPNLSIQDENENFNKSDNFQDSSPTNSLNNSTDELKTKVSQKLISKFKSTQQKSNLLMQLLIELDGILTTKNILVFGATNRPQVLDSALTRPGRFNKIINLNLPNKQKRIEILKLYSKNIGVETTISWNYLANLTFGLSAADLASIMNQSAMKAIQNETYHTVQTIEYGIESVTGYSIQKNKLKSFFTWKKNEKTSSSPFVFINRLAYYQAGKAIVHTLLQYHPNIVSIQLWPQVKISRSHLVTGIVEQEFSQVRTRVELESRIIGFYGGKAAELLALFDGFKNKSFAFQEKTQNKKDATLKKSSKHQQFFYLWQSDLGLQDITFAGWLAQLMITRWYFYSKHIATTKITLLKNNSNVENISDQEMIEFLKEISSEIETEAFKKTHSIKQNSQNWIIQPWLQNQIIKKLEFFYSNINIWSRMYTRDDEKSENTQYVFPDNYYHNNISLKNLLTNFSQTENSSNFSSISKQYNKKNKEQTLVKSTITWNDTLYSDRDYMYHSLILTCFNKSISILDNNRELLDFFASYLMQKEIIREHEVLTLIQTFQKNEIDFSKNRNTSHSVLKSCFGNFDKNQSKIKNETTLNSKNKEINRKSKIQKKIVQKSCNMGVQKKKSRFINFNTIL